MMNSLPSVIAQSWRVWF